MKHLIDKDALVAELNRLIAELIEGEDTMFEQGRISAFEDVKVFINHTLEVKEVDLDNGIQLTWEDIRELYIIFAEVDTEIELCKTDIKTETLGYYQEVLKRFNSQKGKTL